jgi:hypothetical protein
MKHIFFAALCFGGLVVVAPVSAQDEVRYFNRKTQKEDTAKGTIEKESAATITVKYGTAGRKEEISSVDVLDVSYKVDGGLVLDYRKPFNKEEAAFKPTVKDDDRKPMIKEALKEYADLVPKFADKKLVQRNLEYRIARLLAKAAEDDPTQVDAAIDALNKFKTDNPDSWQLIPAAKVLAGLREQTGDIKSAQKIYEELAANDALPKETREEFSLSEARLLIRGNQHANALKKLKDLGGSFAADDPRKAKVDVYVAACTAASGKASEAEKQLKDLIGGKVDNETKALACNALGDLHLRDGKAEVALWDYLWVDVLYNQDREEHAKALFQLSKLFMQVQQYKDATRAEHCLDRLVNEKEFAGSIYQKLAAKARQKGSTEK